MAAVQVTSANTNRQLNANRSIVRTSAGIPYVVLEDVNEGGIEVWKGNSTTPTSFTEQDTANNPANSRYDTPSAAIDSTGVIHIAYYDINGKSSALRYVTFSTGTDTFSGDVSIQDIGGAAPTNYVAIAIDANDKPHIAWIDRNTNMGADYDTVYYTNKVSGSWSTAVEVEGVSVPVNVQYPEIAINGSNIPVIAYGRSATGVRIATGNVNNATSFSLATANNNTTHTYSGGYVSLIFDSGGSGYVSFTDISSPYEVWLSPIGGGGDTDTGARVTDSAVVNTAHALVADGTSLYLFYENSTADVAYYYNTGSGWTSGGVLETGTYNTPRAKWAFWVDNDSGGALLSSTTYYFDGSDAAANDPDSAWTNETNADDGDVDTDATPNSTGTVSSNEITVEGTNAPASGENIIAVSARFYGNANFLNTAINMAVYTDGGVASGVALGTSTKVNATEGYSTYTLLTVPSGGWTWAKVQALEAVIYCTGSTNNGAFAKGELLVTTRSSATEIDYTFADETVSPDIFFNTLSIGTPEVPKTWDNQNLIITSSWMFALFTSINTLLSQLFHRV